MQKWFLVDPGQHIQSARKRGQARLTVATRLLKVVPGSYRDHRVVIYVFDVVILVATNMMKKFAVTVIQGAMGCGNVEIGSLVQAARDLERLRRRFHYILVFDPAIIQMGVLVWFAAQDRIPFKGLDPRNSHISILYSRLHLHQYSQSLLARACTFKLPPVTTPTTSSPEGKKYTVRFLTCILSPLFDNGNVPVICLKPSFNITGQAEDSLRIN
ncbi:hypothetical protein JOM56_012431 [Amanita muscaria]